MLVNKDMLEIILVGNIGEMPEYDINLLLKEKKRVM